MTPGSRLPQIPATRSPGWGRPFDALGLMIKANSFGGYFALLRHESTCLSGEGQEARCIQRLYFMAAAHYPFAPAFYSCLPQ
jgi:hypothetical protein